MMSEVSFGLILAAALLASASPGPATLALSGTAMAQGRVPALWLAFGITTGSLVWSVAAAFGLSAIMFANVWMFQLMRYVGAAYLLYLAVKSARAALHPGAVQPVSLGAEVGRRMYLKGLALHITNPKAILFFGALYAVAVPADASPGVLFAVILVVGLQSTIIFHGFALLFSSEPIARLYFKARRGFEALFAIGFGAAAAKILTARLE